MACEIISLPNEDIPNHCHRVHLVCYRTAPDAPWQIQGWMSEESRQEDLEKYVARGWETMIFDTVVPLAGELSATYLKAQHARLPEFAAWYAATGQAIHLPLGKRYAV